MRRPILSPSLSCSSPGFLHIIPLNRCVSLVGFIHGPDRYIDLDRLGARLTTDTTDDIIRLVLLN